MTEQQKTHFGFKQVDADEKTRLVRQVFNSVASEYDLMNDLMSLGMHRLWKRHAVHLCSIKKNDRVLDLAGGTGDIAGLISRQLGDGGAVTICDISADMLGYGRDRFINKGIVNGINYVQGDAEALPFANDSFDCITIAFGLRNVTDKISALRSMYSTLKYGSRLMVLEFSKAVAPLLSRLYDEYSFKLIPRIGKLVAKNEGGYQYLVESIRMHPDQTQLKQMMVGAGFKKVSCLNLSGGIVAIHRGYKL